MELSAILGILTIFIVLCVLIKNLVRLLEYQYVEVCRVGG